MAIVDEQAGAADAADDRRARGMHDLGIEEMRRFRRVERAFLDAADAAGFVEVRTPTIEPLHLFTQTGALTPQLLDRVYSFLDWDGWSGERVVLRPDGTVPAARWYASQWEGAGPARLCYVQPIYRFVPEGTRQRWQAGAELFDAPAPDGDVEALGLALDLLGALDIAGVEVELAHAAIARAVLEAAGLDAREQIVATDRLLAGDRSLVAELTDRTAGGAEALRLLLLAEQGGPAFLHNLEAAVGASIPAARSAVAELAALGARLDAGGVAYTVVGATTANVEYYSGATFRLRAGGREVASGGRYDRLVGLVGGADVPACGFGADVTALVELLP